MRGFSIPRLIVLGICLGGGCHSGAATPEGNPLQVMGLRITLPAGWHQVPAVSSMRALQAAIPGPGGEAELAVFYFGSGQGGNIEANLQRWMNQVIPDPGTTPQRETFEAGALRITWVDAQGTLKPGQMGMGPAIAQPNTRLLGAVIEGEGGPWFLKVTGPEATVAAQREAFIAMLHTARPSA